MPKFYGVGPWGVSYETQPETERTISGGKMCSCCHELKRRDEFGKNRKSLDGLNSSCKACRNSKTRDRYAKRVQTR